MTAPACGSCTAPVPDGYLCSGCTRDLAQLLLTAASIAPDLDDAVAKLLKRGSGGRRSETEAPLPVDLAASEAAACLRLCLGSWIRVTTDHLSDDDPWPPNKTGDMASWLLARINRIRQHHRAASALRDIREAVHRALAVIDQRPERMTAGTCAACSRPLTAEVGADFAECPCGLVTTGIIARRAKRAAEAEVLGTAAEISGALAKIGITVPRGTITSWASRGRLGARGKSGMYALSDVLSLHAQRRR